jgi:hypothetical protein
MNDPSRNIQDSLLYRGQTNQPSGAAGVNGANIGFLLKLHHLKLNDTAVTHKALPTLKQLKSLQDIAVPQDDCITDEKVELTNALPRCRLESNSPRKGLITHTQID